jgi:hypothetical protein
MEASWFGYRSSGDHPQDHLVKSGYKQDMKVKKFKHPSHFWLCMLEPNKVF